MWLLRGVLSRPPVDPGSAPRLVLSLEEACMHQVFPGTLDTSLLHEWSNAVSLLPSLLELNNMFLT